MGVATFISFLMTKNKKDYTRVLVAVALLSSLKSLVDALI